MHINGDHPLRRLRDTLNLSIDDLAKVSGVSAQTIKRAEKGQGLYPGSRRLLCQYFNKSPEELGLLPQQAQIQLFLPVAGEAPLCLGINDMKRRELLRLLSLAGGTLILPFDLVDWERLADALTHPTHLDEEVLQDCASLNQGFWHVFRASSHKRVVLDGVLEHMAALNQHLHTSHTAEQHQQLCALIADLSQLAGEVMFDANSYADAASCYTFAASAAKEAKLYDLWACALIRQSFISIYDRHFHDALPLLQMADRLAQRGDSTFVTRHWAAVVSAEALAGTGNLPACQRSLDLAEGVRDMKNGANGTWLRFDGTRLPEERGGCFVKLERPDLAEPVLQEALAQLPTSTRRRGIVLTDLGLVAVQQGDIERACNYGHQVVEIAKQGTSGVLKKGLHRLQSQLEPFANTGMVNGLNKQIQTLASPE